MTTELLPEAISRENSVSNMLQVTPIESLNFLKPKRDFKRIFGLTGVDCGGVLVEWPRGLGDIADGNAPGKERRFFKLKKLE